MAEWVVAQWSYAQLPLWSECEFEKYTMKSQTYLHVKIVSNRLGGVVIQECELCVFIHC